MRQLEATEDQAENGLFSALAPDFDIDVSRVDCRRGKQTPTVQPVVAPLLSAVAVCETLSNAVVQDAGVAELTRTFAATTGRVIVLIDPDRRVLAQSDTSVTANMQAT